MSDTQTSSMDFGRRSEPPVATEAPRQITPKTAKEALRPEPGTPPPPRRSRASRNQIIVFMNFLMSLVVFVVIAACAALYFGKQAFESPGPITQARTFLVKPNSGVGQIAAQLEQNGFITDATIFRIGVRTYGGE